VDMELSIYVHVSVCENNVVNNNDDDDDAAELSVADLKRG